MTKTLTFAALHFTVAFSVAYLLTGSMLIGGLMALIEPAINTVVFFFHEKAWVRYERNKTTDGAEAAPASMAKAAHAGCLHGRLFEKLSAKA